MCCSRCAQVDLAFFSSCSGVCGSPFSALVENLVVSGSRCEVGEVEVEPVELEDVVERER